MLEASLWSSPCSLGTSSPLLSTPDQNNLILSCWSPSTTFPSITFTFSIPGSHGCHHFHFLYHTDLNQLLIFKFHFHFLNWLSPLSLSSPDSKKYGRTAGTTSQPPCPCKPALLHKNSIFPLVPDMYGLLAWLYLSCILYLSLYLCLYLKLTEHCILFFSACICAVVSFNLCLSLASWA